MWPGPDHSQTIHEQLIRAEVLMFNLSGGFIAPEQYKHLSQRCLSSGWVSNFSVRHLEKWIKVCEIVQEQTQINKLRGQSSQRAHTKHAQEADVDMQLL